MSLKGETVAWQAIVYTRPFTAALQDYCKCWGRKGGECKSWSWNAYSYYALNKAYFQVRA